MSDKEQISTLISGGVGFPPVNPYLDDSTQADDNVGAGAHVRKTRTKRKAPDLPTIPPSKSLATPDPKEYIAELERPEEEGLY